MSLRQLPSDLPKSVVEVPLQQQKKRVFVKSFEQFPLSSSILESMQKMGFEKPSEIQSQAWSILLNEKTDFLGLAATGTGKTAAFAVPMIEQIDPSLRKIQALILCPTRELALQVSNQISLLGSNRRIEALPIYGGASYRDQFRGISRGLPIVVGTPGRLVDHIKQGSIDLENVKHIILDEADEMISMGFKEDLETILSAAKKDDAQIWLFSATMSKEVRKVADEYLRTPKFAEVNRVEKVPEKITQQYFVARESNKAEILCKIIDMAEGFYGIIFCQTKALVCDLTQYLTEHGYKVDSLHGDKDQKSRERTMQAFRDHKVKILVCTDVASRGLDVKDITHVINYSIPRELESYVHRIGRTARSGKEGFAFSLVAPSQLRMLDRVEKITKSKISEGVIPSRKEVIVKKIGQYLPTFQKAPVGSRALEVLDESWKTAIQELSKEEIVAKFLSLTHPALFNEDAKPKMPGPQGAKDESRGNFGRDNRGGDRRSRGGDRGDDRRARGGDRDGGRSRGHDRRDFQRADRRDDRRQDGDSRTEGRFEQGSERRSQGGFGSGNNERGPRNFDNRGGDNRRSRDNDQRDGGGFKRFDRRQDDRGQRPARTNEMRSNHESRNTNSEDMKFESLLDFVRSDFPERRKEKSSNDRRRDFQSDEKSAKKPHPGVRFGRKPKKNFFDEEQF